MNMDDQPYVEIENVNPIYCSGVASVLRDGVNLHFAMYRNEIAADGTEERIIVARVVLPAAQYVEARDFTDGQLGAMAAGGFTIPPRADGGH